MSTAAICVIAVCALLAFAISACVVMSVVESVLVSGAMQLPPACPCRNITSITLPAGTKFDPPEPLGAGVVETAARKVH